LYEYTKMLKDGGNAKVPGTKLGGGGKQGRMKKKKMDLAAII
jgi:hypothetical protein